MTFVSFLSKDLPSELKHLAKDAALRRASEPCAAEVAVVGGASLTKQTCCRPTFMLYRTEARRMRVRGRGRRRRRGGGGRRRGRKRRGRGGGREEEVEEGGREEEEEEESGRRTSTLILSGLHTATHKQSHKHTSRPETTVMLLLE